MDKIHRVHKVLLCILIAGLCQVTLDSFFRVAMAKNRHSNTPYQEYVYQQKVLRQIEKAKYHRSLLPESGFMTKAEYEKRSMDVPTSDTVIPEPKLPKDINMKYIPQPVFKLTRYNDPPGSPEVRIDRKFNFDRQVNGQGITSPDRSFMVYPAIYYYVENQCTAADLFVIPLDKTLPDVDRILRANVIKKDQTPILSTDKNISEKYTFRTLTPVDFSPDSSKLIVKEKIGYTYDGIWKTNLWVYDFETKTARNLCEIRDAIRYYWLNTKGTVLDEKRWDIYPLGFSANDPSIIVINAYGYTGTTPKFLGTWSIDCKGERSELVSLFNPEAEISINGFKLVKSGVVNPTDLVGDQKQKDKIIKQKRKIEKKAKKQILKEGKKVFKLKIKEMKQQESVVKKQYKEQQKINGSTAID